MEAYKKIFDETIRGYMDEKNKFGYCKIDDYFIIFDTETCFINISKLNKQLYTKIPNTIIKQYEEKSYKVNKNKSNTLYSGKYINPSILSHIINTEDTTLLLLTYMLTKPDINDLINYMLQDYTKGDLFNMYDSCVNKKNKEVIVSNHQCVIVIKKDEELDLKLINQADINSYIDRYDIIAKIPSLKNVPFDEMDKYKKEHETIDINELCEYCLKWQII